MLNQILAERYWAIEADHLEILLGQLQDKDLILSINNEQASSILSLFASNSNYEVVDGVGIVKVEGPLLKKAHGLLAMLLGIGSYEAIADSFNKALKNDSVKAIMLKIDSPGGVVSGVASLSNLIYEGRRQKPVMTFVDGSMSSAALWIGSSANQIILSDSTTKVGSLGVIGVHREVSKLAEKVGIQFTIFSSGDYKASGNEYSELSEKDTTYIQSRIDYYHQEFLKAIGRNLNIPVAQIPEGVQESRVYIGSEVIENKLASEILCFDEAMQRLKSMAGSRSSTSFKSKTSAKAAMEGNKMEFRSATLLDIVKEIQSTDDLDNLSALEESLLIECKRREANASNWIEERDVETLKSNVTSLIAQQRRMIQAHPKIEERQQLYNLGKQIGTSKI